MQPTAEQAKYASARFDGQLDVTRAIYSTNHRQLSTEDKTEEEELYKEIERYRDEKDKSKMKAKEGRKSALRIVEKSRFLSNR